MGYKKGDRVRVADCSGIGSGRDGTVLGWDNPNTRAYRTKYPFVGERTQEEMGWIVVKLDGDMNITAYPENRLKRIKNGYL